MAEPETNNDTGRRKVAAVVRGGAQRLAIAAKTPKDPASGEERDGVKPGQWRKPGEFGVPDDCPVQPLGMDGDTLYVIDALGQLAGVAPSGFGINFAQRLFAGRAGYLEWAWPRVGAKGVVTGLDLNQLRADLYQSGARKGLWKAVEKVRGLGAWQGRGGQLILHCGQYLSVNGRVQQTGEVDGHFYPRRPTTYLPFAEPVEGELNPAPELFDAFRTFNWRRPDIDPLLLTGWIAAGFLGGALPWRPSMFLVGDKAVGKSTLQNLVKEIFGPAIVSTPDTTPAGIYQRIGNDALPVAVDELEAEADDRKVRAVVKLARLAASGGLMLRGGADHQGVEFQARSTFLFSAINAPWMPAQDLSRIAVLSVGKLDPAKVARAPVLKEADTIGARMLRRLADAWGADGGGFLRLWEEYRAALRLGGHDSRGQDTYGTFLACAHMALGDEAMEAAGFPIEKLDEWGERMAAAAQPERESARENWRACLERLLTSRVDAWRSGERGTVGILLDGYLTTNESTFTETRRLLAQVDLGLIERTNDIAPGKLILAVPNEGPLLAQLFAGSPWGGSGGGGTWKDALRQGPGNVVMYDKTVNKQRIGGFSRRCTLIVFDEFVKLTEGDE
jgi:hypothetical protein